VVSGFWSEAVALALVGGPTTDEDELATWVARNLAELALLVEVADGPVGVLDAAVHAAGLERASPRFTKRLRGIRARLGAVPAFYPNGTVRQKPPAPLSSIEKAACGALLDFAEGFQGHLDLAAPTTSAMGGHGRAAVEARATWRGIPSARRPIRYIELDIPGDLVWRAWMTHPDGSVVRVVNDERLTDSAFDIWWGVHDGTHLDHLAGFATAGPAPIEYGAGLLVAEALTMSMELLAGVESAGDPSIEAQVRSGILERLGRLPSLFSDPDLGERAQAAGVEPESEFTDLPTLARAYVVGPLLVLGGREESPFIPVDLRFHLRRRWTEAARIHQGARTILSASAGVTTSESRLEQR